MSKLLARAKASFISAQSNYKHISEDDAFMDICCFELQQSIEMALKYIVEMTGNRYAENHDLRANLNIMNRIGYDFPYEKQVRDKAPLLYEWETESRYRESFVATKQDIDEVMDLTQQILFFADSLVGKEKGEFQTEMP